MAITQTDRDVVVEEGPHAEGACPAAEPDPSPAPYETMQVAFEAAVGGGYQMSDGRDFWIDSPVAREIATRIVRAGFRFNFPDGGCPCCGEVDAVDLSSHMCGGCHRFVCGGCKIDAAGEPSPCCGICKDCRAKGLDEGALAVRSLKRIEAELKAGDIGPVALGEVETLACSIIALSCG